MKRLLLLTVWLLFLIATPASGDDLYGMDNLLEERLEEAELGRLVGEGVKVLLPEWIDGEDWRIRLWDEAGSSEPTFNLTSGSGNTQINGLIK